MADTRFIFRNIGWVCITIGTGVINVESLQFNSDYIPAKYDILIYTTTKPKCNCSKTKTKKARIIIS